MRFLPQNKRRAFIYLAILLISGIGIAYLNVFKGSSGIPPAVSPVASPVTSPAQIASPLPAASRLLPFGSEIDTAILGNPKFKVLKAAPPLVVSPEELGKTNLFAK
jgi:hypothetical protein